MSSRMENKLRAIQFGYPDYIPMEFHINGACWEAYDQKELFDLMETHPLLFPDFKRSEGKFIPKYGNCARKDEPYTDDWGCYWQTTLDGIVGTVTKHPLDDWAKYKDYQIPDPSKCMGIGAIDWEEERKHIAECKANGEFVGAGLRHGHTFLQICDIRGYENVIFDMYDEEPLLDDLLEKLYEFNKYIIEQYLDMGIDMIIIPEDLGMQHGPMVSPELFERYILPYYRKMVKLAKDRGALVHMHSDGDIRTLAHGIIEGGVDVLNLQDLVNGIPWIKENLKGKVCIDLDIDRQSITRFGTPEEIDELIHTAVRELGSPEGGLTMIYGLYPDVPIENVKALMDAMEKYAFYYNK